MGRSIIPLPVPPQRYNEIQAMIQSALISDGFKLTDYKGEQCYKKGSGMATAMQFIKVAINQNGFFLEAWLRSGVGNAYVGGEMGLEGVVGAIPKKMLSERVKKIHNLVYTVLNSGNGGTAENIGNAQTAQQTAAKFCPQCGTPVAPGSAFCTKCGAKF